MEILYVEGINDIPRSYWVSLKKALKKAGEFMEKDWYNFFIEPKLVLEKEDKERKLLGLEDIIKRKENFVITGEPGIGKSSFLRWAGIWLCEKGKDYKKLPVHLHLIKYSGDLKDTLNTEVGKHSKELVSKGYKENLDTKLEKGEAVFLLDALDETGKVSDTSDKIKELVSDPIYGKNKFIVSLRTNIYTPALLPDFQELKMQLFSEEQIKEYLTKKLKEESEKVYQKILEFNLLDFARLPLMLKFISDLRGELEGIKNKADLYERVLINEFSKREREEKGRDDFDVYKKIEAMAELAFYLQTDKEIIKEYGGRLIGFNETRNFLRNQVSGRDEYQTNFFNEIWKNGLLVKEGDLCRFLHLTIQEYLAARAIKKKLDEGKFTVREFVDKYVKYEDEIFS